MERLLRHFVREDETLGHAAIAFPLRATVATIRAAIGQLFKFLDRGRSRDLTGAPLKEAFEFDEATK